MVLPPTWQELLLRRATAPHTVLQILVEEPAHSEARRVLRPPTAKGVLRDEMRAWTENRIAYWIVGSRPRQYDRRRKVLKSRPRQFLVWTPSETVFSVEPVRDSF